MDFTDTSRYNREKKRMGAHFVNNRSKLIKKIQRNLSDFAAAIKKDTESGRTDILIDAEEICRGLLNIVFGYKLKNLNQSNRNFPAIDLADDDQRVAVQITSSNTNAKIMNTIHKFLDHSLDQQYDTLLIFILVDTTFRQRKAPPLPPSLNLQIMTFVDFMQTIKALSIEKLDETASYLEKEIGTDDPEPSGTTALIPDLTTSAADLSEIERQVLFFAGFLPEAGLERDVFEYGLTPEQKKSVPDLIKQSVLYSVETLLRVHPDIRSSIPNIIPAPNHITYFDLLWEFENSRHWDRISMKRENAVHQALAHIFSAAAERFPESALTYSLRSAELWKNIHEYSRALTQEQKVLQLLTSVQSNSWEVARAHHFSGECYSELKEHNLALKDWKETLSLCRNFLHVSPYDLAEAFHYVGKAMTELELYEDAEDHLLSALELLENLRRNSKHFSPQPWLRNIYVSLSKVYTKLGLNTLGMTCSQNALRLPTEQENLWQFLTENRWARYRRKPVLNLPVPEWRNPVGFIGRKAELAWIGEELKKGTKPVIVAGLGGVGKTALALMFQKSWPGNVYFATFRDSFTRTLADSVGMVIPPQERRGLNEEQTAELALSYLRRCEPGDLLIVDNAEITGRNWRDLMRDPFYEKLLHLPMAILITTRHRDTGGMWLDRLDRDDLREIFRRHAVQLSVEEMDALIDAVGGHSMTVDAIARTIRESWGNVTPNQILTAMTEGTLDQADFDEIETNYVLEQQPIYAHLRALFDLSGISEDGKYALRCATLLPQTGMDEALFRHALPDGAAKEIKKLEKKGWVDRKEGLVTIHPVVRLVCRTELEPTKDNCRAFLHGIMNQYDRKRYDHVKFRQMAELFENASTTLEDKTGFWAGKAGYFWSEVAEPQRALSCDLRYVEKMEQHQPDSKNLATGYDNVGSTYGDLGEHQKALEYLLKALAIRERVLPEDHPDLAQSYNNVGSTYGDLGDHEKELEYDLKALAIRERVLPEDHPDLATSYNNVGMTYGDLGEHQKALEYQQKALAIRKRVLPENHPDLAISYNHLGYTYSYLGDYEKALEFLLKALTIQEQILPPIHPALAHSFDNIGSVYNDLGDHEKELEYNQKALAVRERVLPGNHPDLALSCSSIAWTYYDLGQIGEAATHMRRAADIINRSTLPENHPNRVNLVKWADEFEAIAWEAQDLD